MEKSVDWSSRAPIAINEAWFNAIDKLLSENWDESDAPPTLRVRYPNGESSKVESPEEFRRLLIEGGQKPQSISVTRYSVLEDGLNFHLHHTPFFKTTTISVTGCPRDVNHVVTEFQRSMKAASPNWPFFHRMSVMYPICILLAMMTGTAVMLAAVALIGSFEERKSEYLLASNAISAILVFILLKQYEKTFPRLEIQYGLDWERLKARRNTFAAIALAILPVALGAIFVDI